MDKRNSESTGKCIVLITPDKERTMNTYLGATEYLSDIDIDEDWLKGNLTNWNHAFAIIDFFKNGDYKVEVVEIINGKTSLWGEVLT